MTFDNGDAPPLHTLCLGSDPALTESLGERLGQSLAAGDCLGLVGDLGAGKTTLTRGVARGLAVSDPDAVASPTYLLAIEHPGQKPLVHLDAYLDQKTRGFLLDGGVDYLQEVADGVIVVEWADRNADLLVPAQTLWVQLGPRADGQAGRRVTFRGPKERFGWVEALPDLSGAVG